MLTYSFPRTVLFYKSAIHVGSAMCIRAYPGEFDGYRLKEGELVICSTHVNAGCEKQAKAIKPFYSVEDLNRVEMHLYECFLAQVSMRL